MCIILCFEYFDILASSYIHIVILFFIVIMLERLSFSIQNRYAGLHKYIELLRKSTCTKISLLDKSGELYEMANKTTFPLQPRDFKEHFCIG